MNLNDEDIKNLRKGSKEVWLWQFIEPATTSNNER